MADGNQVEQDINHEKSQMATCGAAGHVTETPT